ncbi:MAG: lipid-binding SYLF domain-containing protein [Limnochordia bacterium]|nr:lipid-binding SYLF domain-containing protein [Limnochordia bacterium]
MRRIIFVTLVLVLSLSSLGHATKAPDMLLADAVLALQEIAEQPDSEHFHRMLQNSHGVAIFPSLIKAGLGLGGRFGEGVIVKYDSEKKTWYGPYFVQMKGISYGFQVGVQTTSLVLVVAADEGMRSLQEGKITLGGNLSVAVGPIGRSAEASTNLDLNAIMYSYSISKGAFIGASFEGASIDNNVNANQVYWNRALAPEEMLTRKASKKEIRGLIEELNRIIDQAMEVAS